MEAWVIISDIAAEEELATTEEVGARMLVVQGVHPIAWMVDTLSSTTKASQTPNKSMAMPHSLDRETPLFASSPTLRSPRPHL